MADFIYGLDFGTSTTLMAIPTDGMPRIIPIGRDNNWMPSVVAISNTIELSVGDMATDQNHADQIRSPKTAITNDIFGKLTSPSGREVDADKAILSILLEAKKKADENGLEPDGMVRMSCPAMWTGEQRLRLANLANLAGINTNVDAFLDEPIGACVAWWWNNFYKRGRKTSDRILVFDLGGGTLDIAVADIYGETTPEITVLAARGISIAGDSLDLKLADYFEARLISEFAINISNREDYSILRNLVIRASKRIKEALSVFQNAVYELDDPDYSFLPKIEISQTDLEMVYRPDLDRAISCVKTTIRETYLKNMNRNSEEMSVFAKTPIEEIAKDIRFIVLAGGMSQIPIIKEELRKILPNAISEHVTEAHEATEAIVKGVANRNEFSDLNIHRPNFNFFINWKDDNQVILSEIIYPAFKPLYEDYELLSGNFLLSYKKQWMPPGNISEGRAEIYLRSVGGRPTTMNLDGRLTQHIPVKISRWKNIMFSIYLDGTIMITHEDGVISLRVKEWPYIRWEAGKDSRNEIHIESIGNLSQIDVRDKSWLYYDH
jgi:molecular chaperone DnaK (HSP70)